MTVAAPEPRSPLVPSGSRDEVTILGVRFDRLTRTDALTWLVGTFGRGEARKVYIVNAHTINLAWKEESFREILNQADLLLNDGSGVQIGSRLAGKPFPDNLVGTDLAPELCARAVDRGIGVYILGGEAGVAERAGQRLQASCPGLKISGTHHGYFDEVDDRNVTEAVNRTGTGILLVGFGNPLQEKWIHRNALRLTCDVCIGVGGLLDHLAGRLRRAPLWMRRSGIEWTHILMDQPHKWRRYLIGNPLFLSRLVKERIRRPR